MSIERGLSNGAIRLFSNRWRLLLPRSADLPALNFNEIGFVLKSRPIYFSWLSYLWIDLSTPIVATLLSCAKAAQHRENLGFVSCSSNRDDDPHISYECCVILAGNSIQRVDLSCSLGCALPITWVSASRTWPLPAATTSSSSASIRRTHHERAGLGSTRNLCHVDSSHDRPSNRHAYPEFCRELYDGKLPG